MKFRKEYQTYLLIVIAIIIAGYFLKHLFFNKKKKVIEGQAGTTTYYRIAFSSTDSIDTTPTNQDLLKELILTQYDTVLTDATGSKYVQPGDKYKVLIPLIPDTDTLLIKDSTGAVLGLKVVAVCANRLEYFKKKAAAAAADTADSAAAAVAAYDYARLILSNTYKDNLNIMALIAAANLFTIVGQPNINITDKVVTAALATLTFEVEKSQVFFAFADAVDAGDFFISDAAKATFVANFIAWMMTVGREERQLQINKLINQKVTLAETLGLDSLKFFTSDATEDAFEAAFKAVDAKIRSLFADDLDINMIDAIPVDYYAVAAAGMYAYAAPAPHYAAALADAYAKGITLTSATITSNVNYQKVITKYGKAAFTTAAGLIYLSIYEIINKI